MATWGSSLAATSWATGAQFLAALDSSGSLWTAWQDGFDWNYWTAPPGAPSTTSASSLAAVQTSTGVGLWTIDSSGWIWATGSPSPGSFSSWVAWQKYQSLGPAKQIAAGARSDGTIELWAIDASGAIWSAWQWSPNNHTYSSWQKNWSGGTQPFVATQIAVAPLSDKGLQFWAIDDKGAIWSLWQTTSDPNSPWTAWSSSWSKLASQPFTASKIAAAPLPNQLVQLFVTDNTGAVWNTAKASTQPGAAWTQWTKSWISDTTPSSQTVCTTKGSVWVVDTSGHLWTTVWSSATSSFWNWSLMFSLEKQLETSWCWAACTAGTNHFYSPASVLTQCAVANATFKGGSTCDDEPPPNVSDCCSNPSACNVAWCISLALKAVGNANGSSSDPVSQPTVTSQTQSGQPLAIRIVWGNGPDAHFIMGVGGGVNDMVTVRDPWYGVSFVTYASLTGGTYNGNGKWHQSYYTQQ